MAGYSSTPLERKLGVKRETTVFLDHPPTRFRLDAATTTRLPKRIELALSFHTHAGTLERRLPELIGRLEQAGAIWICWPKKAARTRMKTDLDEHDVRRTGLASGLVDVKVAAIDETWSALKFVRRLRDRTDTT